MPLTTRQKLRQSMRARRRLISKETADIAAKQLSHNLLNLPFLRDAQQVAVYFANDHEIDPANFIKEWNVLGKHCYLPVLDAEKVDHLTFVQYRLQDQLKHNRYKIPEPHIADKDICPAHLLDVVLIPLVAFDAQGGRLGMGKGYYDRTFAFMKEKTLSKPLLVGLAYACQYVDRIAVEPWDVPLHGVMTEVGYQDFRA